MKLCPSGTTPSPLNCNVVFAQGLSAEKRFIDETDHVEKRTERSEEVRQKALSEQSAITEHVERLEAEKESNPMESLKELQRLYGLLLSLAAVLFLADCPVQYGLNSVAFPNLPWFVLTIMSMLIAAGLGVVVEVAAFAVYFDPYRPRRTVRLCLTSAGISGGVAALAGTTLLFARTATGGAVDFLAEAVPISMWALGETLPVAAGFISAAAWTLGYPTRRDNQIDRGKSRLSELLRFIDWLDRDKQKLASRTVAVLLIGLLSSGRAFSQGAIALRPGTAASAAPSAAISSTDPILGDSSSIGIAAPRRCLIYVDMTQSVAVESRRQTVSRIRDTVPSFIKAFQCTIVGVGSFADEGPFSPVTEVEIPQRPQTEDCAKAISRVEGLEKITQSVSGFQKHYQERATKECGTRVVTQLNAFGQKFQESVKKLDTALGSDLPTRGQCTAINSLLSAAVERATTIVLATDGSESCERGPRAFRLSANKRLIFVLLPPRGPATDGGRVALRVANEWKERVPGLKVVYPSYVTTQLWDELAIH